MHLRTNAHTIFFISNTQSHTEAYSQSRTRSTNTLHSPLTKASYFSMLTKVAAAAPWYWLNHSVPVKRSPASRTKVFPGRSLMSAGNVNGCVHVSIMCKMYSDCIHVSNMCRMYVRQTRLFVPLTSAKKKSCCSKIVEEHQNKFRVGTKIGSVWLVETNKQFYA